MDEILVPISMFAMILGIVWVIVVSQMNGRKAVQKTIQAAINNNAELTPETIKAMGAKPEKPYADLRAGAILVGLAVGFIAMGMGISKGSGDAEVFPILLGVSALPGFIGVALILLHFLLKDKK
ncbi:MAG: DUF6249 domain-containing protein [bacterium]